MGFDLTGSKPTSRSGESFECSIWAWPVLLEVIRLAIRKGKLRFDTSGWAYNDGDGLDGTGTRRLSFALEVALADEPLAHAVEFSIENDGTLMAWANLDKGKAVACVEEPDPRSIPLCVADKIRAAGGQIMNSPKFRVSRERVQELITFFRDSGGFEIR